jgi:hypothetical protein
MGGTDTSAAWQASVTACTVVMWGTRPTDDPSSPNLGHDTAYTQSRNKGRVVATNAKVECSFG